MSRFFALFALVISAALNFVALAFHVLVVKPAMSLFSPPRMQLAASGSFFAIDPALYADNRHEAGVSRRSAARHV